MRRRQSRPIKLRSVRVSFAAMLRATLDAAPCTWWANGAGLYVAQLNAERSFAVALHIHARLGGPDPRVLRERAQRAGLRAPMMVGAAPVALLSRALETFATPEEGRLRTGAVREMAAEGAVPVVIMEQDAAEVTTLATIEGEMESAPATSRHDMEDLGGWFGPIVAAEA